MRKKLTFLMIALCFILLCACAYGKCVVLNEKNPGSKVDIKKHIVAGKINIFDFYAEWCGPCKKIGPSLEALNDDEDNNIVVQKVNIDDWDSPVCKQYKIESVPCFMIYDEKGKLIAEGDDAYNMVLEMIDKNSK